MKIGGILSAIHTTLSGMSNQMKRLDVISENIANAERAPDAKGRVYHRKVVVPKKTSKGHIHFDPESSLPLRRQDQNHMSLKSAEEILTGRKPDEFPLKVVEEKGVKLVYNPSHPRADENGYVKMPNVNPVEEMVDLIAATRTYEANVTVLNAAKQLAKRALEI